MSAASKNPYVSPSPRTVSCSVTTVTAVAAAITLAAGPLEAGLLMATAVAIVSTPARPIFSHDMTVAWLVFAIVFLGFLGARTLLRPRTPRAFLVDS